MTAPSRFLSRWSRLKLKPSEAVEAKASPAIEHAEGLAVDTPADADTRSEPVREPLPDAATLTLESDFTAFLKEEVGEAVRRQALKKLFNDPHFNVMDGLDTYIDDYSVSTPIPPELMAKLRSAREWLAVDEAADNDADETTAARGVEAAANEAAHSPAGDVESAHPGAVAEPEPDAEGLAPEQATSANPSAPLPAP